MFNWVVCFIDLSGVCIANAFSPCGACLFTVLMPFNEQKFSMLMVYLIVSGFGALAFFYISRGVSVHFVLL
jgi:Flp pilus assembly protein protease CpaA